MLWKAPLALALAAVPEFLQHIVEIQLGMFVNLRAFRAHELDTARMLLGGLKIAGLLLAIAASARFWRAERSGRPWYDPRGIFWNRFLLGFLLFMVVPAAPLLLRGEIGNPAANIISLAITVAMLPGLFMMIGGLLGDRETANPDYWVRSWPWAPLIGVLLVLAFAPLQWVHGYNHHLAIGAAPLAVWGLMAWDALIVGVLAGLTGTALYLGYSAFARRRFD